MGENLEGIILGLEWKAWHVLKKAYCKPLFILEI